MKFEEKREVGAARKLVLSGSASVSLKRGGVSGMVVRGSTAEIVSSVRTKLRGDTLEISLAESSIAVTDGSITMVNSAHGAVQIGMVARGAGPLQIFHGRHGSVRFVRGNASQTYDGKNWSDLNVDGTIIDGVEAFTPPMVSIEITLPVLDELDVSGAARASLVDLLQERLTVEVQGAGHVEANGKVGRISVEVSGAGLVKMRDLAVKSARLEVSGAGKLKTTVHEDVKASVSGAGSIKIFGAPAVRTTHVSGAGQIKFKD